MLSVFFVFSADAATFVEGPYVTLEYSGIAYSIAAGDINNDGHMDLAVAYGSDAAPPNRLYLNNGTKNPFEGISSKKITDDRHDSRSIALGDVNGDGYLDVAVANTIGVNGGQYNRIYINNGTSNPFSANLARNISGDKNPSRVIVLVDMDRDGDLDAVVGDHRKPTRLYLNNGAGEFSAGENISNDALHTRSLAAGDVNGDGYNDVVVCGEYERCRLYLSNGTAAPFSGVIGKDLGKKASIITYSVVLADANGDGRLDLFMADWGRPIRLFLNNGTSDPYANMAGEPLSPDAYHTMALAAGDLDGDGDVDLVAGNFLSGEPNRVYLNNGTINPFAGVIGENVANDSYTIQKMVLVDIDNDGDLDLAAVSKMGSTRARKLYFNTLNTR